MTIHDIEKLPPDERAVVRASWRYYRALLGGASAGTRQRLYGCWQSEIRRCWLDARKPV